MNVTYFITIKNENKKVARLGKKSASLVVVGSIVSDFIFSTLPKMGIRHLHLEIISSFHREKVQPFICSLLFFLDALKESVNSIRLLSS